MFSGIVEAQSKILSMKQGASVLQIVLARPPHFSDLKTGDSICVNGICLTLEKYSDQEICFSVGAETLRLLGLGINQWTDKDINLERSLCFGDRIHGHLVTGHVDVLGTVEKSLPDGSCWQLEIKLLKNEDVLIWQKGSVTLNGVSLTVNRCVQIGKYVHFNLCLIPETITRTNLSALASNDFVNIEFDYLAKAMSAQRALIENEAL